MIYILDAYNIMHKMGIVHGRDNQMENQTEFIQYVSARKKKRNDKYILVFDGQKRSETHRQGLKIMYSDSSSKADGVIKELSEHYEGKQAKVITEDRAIIDYVRRGGLQIISSSEFIAEDKNFMAGKSEEKRIEELGNLSNTYWSELFKKGKE